MQELIGYYITMEEYFMRETVNKVGLRLLLTIASGCAPQTPTEHPEGGSRAPGRSAVAEEVFSFPQLWNASSC